VNRLRWQDSYSKIRCHQRLRLATGYNASSSSTGGILDNIHPGNGGFSLNPQVTPRLFGSNILM
jgi:hypothetical protein